MWGSTDERSSIVVNTPTGSKVLDTGSPEWKAVMLQRIDGRVEQFVATGARVILLAEPPSPHSLSGVDSANLGALLKTRAACDGGPPNGTTSSTNG